jgi:hypothetical protein
MPIITKLGFGYGAMIDNEDGTVSYVKPVSISQQFRVRVADVTGFSVSKGQKALERTLKIMGNGTELASVSVNHGVAEKVEAYVRAHPEFGRPVPPPAQASSGLVADELIKLAQLRDAGVLTVDEFASQKAKLLAR